MNFHRIFRNSYHQLGGAALEYILTSIFGLMLSVAVIAYVGKAIRSKMSIMEDKLGIEFEDELFENFKN